MSLLFYGHFFEGKDRQKKRTKRYLLELPAKVAEQKLENAMKKWAYINYLIRKKSIFAAVYVKISYMYYE